MKRSSKRKSIGGLRRRRAYGQRRLSAGFRRGFDQGYIWGRSNAVLTHTPLDISVKRDIRVLFVTSGKGVPYSPIDQAVQEALQANTIECMVVEPWGPVLELAEMMKPDLVLVLEGLELPLSIPDALRSKGIRTAVWFTDDPYYADITQTIAPHYDDIFTLELNCVDFYRSLGCTRVHYLPLGANPAIFRPQPVGFNYQKQVSFIGSAYWNRVDFIHHIAPVLASTDSLVSGWWWDRLPQPERLPGRIHPGLWLTPEETAKYYYGSRIVLNLHRAFDDESYNFNSRRLQAFSVNPRTFEIAASGAFQMTDERSDLVNFYNPGTEIITYYSPQDCMDKIRYYLAHEDERREIALRGLRRTLQQHTYSRRIQALLDSIFGGGISI